MNSIHQDESYQLSTSQAYLPSHHTSPPSPSEYLYLPIKSSTCQCVTQTANLSHRTYALQILHQVRIVIRNTISKFHLLISLSIKLKRQLIKSPDRQLLVQKLISQFSLLISSLLDSILSPIRFDRRVIIRF